MSRIKILGQKVDPNKPREMPHNADLSMKRERFQAGGKHKLTLDKSFKQRKGQVS
jgi:hypothetical protein